jgi:hypothetical protein
MNLVRRCWRLLHEAGGQVLRDYVSYKTALSDRLRLGIGARLGIAFAAVAALVLAANFIVEQGVLIERTTEITRTLPAPAAPAKATAIVPPPSVALVPPVVTPVHRMVTSDALLHALDRFDEAVLERVAANSESANAKYQRAIVDMNRAAIAFMTTAASISGKAFARVGATLKVHQRQGDTLVLTSDNRHEMMLKYATLFEALNARDKSGCFDDRVRSISRANSS